MTKEEIMAIKAGRELDALVASEIFGIEVEWDYSPWDINQQESKLPFRKNEARICLGSMAHPVLNDIFNYSTDISAAWEVWLAVTKEGWNDWAIYPDSDGDVTIEHCPSNYKGSKEKECGDFFVDGKFPEAICKAALLARLCVVSEGKKEYEDLI